MSCDESNMVQKRRATFPLLPYVRVGSLQYRICGDAMLEMQQAHICACVLKKKFSAKKDRLYIFLAPIFNSAGRSQNVWKLVVKGLQELSQKNKSYLTTNNLITTLLNLTGYIQIC